MDTNRCYELQKIKNKRIIQCDLTCADLPWPKSRSSRCWRRQCDDEMNNWIWFVLWKLLPPSRNIRFWRVQTQETTVRENDFYTPHFTLPTNTLPTHQPHSILSYPSRTLYFGTKFERFRTLYFETEGVHHHYQLTMSSPWVTLTTHAYILQIS
jgi:hypothetical protein